MGKRIQFTHICSTLTNANKYTQLQIQNNRSRKACKRQINVCLRISLFVPFRPLYLSVKDFHLHGDIYGNHIVQHSIRHKQFEFYARYAPNYKAQFLHFLISRNHVLCKNYHRIVYGHHIHLMCVRF